MISSKSQISVMGFLFAVMIVLYCLRFEHTPLITAVAVSLAFPVQIVFWRLSYGRKAKDFFFCFSLIALAVILKHFWEYSDLLFYAFSILMAAVLRYRVFLAIGASGITLEALREHFYNGENLEEIGFRYLLFLVAGTLTYLLLLEEKRQKEEFKKELDDLRYGIQEMEQAPVELLSDEGQIARKVDAALALEEALKRILQLVHKLFKSNTVLFWQYLADRDRLRIWQQIGETKDLRENLLIALGEGPIGWAALNRKVFLQQEREEGVKISLYRKNPVIRSFLAVPVMEGERLEGVLTLDSSHLNFFAPEAETAISSFASQVSETIRMARVALEREERAFEFQAFYHASKELSSLIDFEEIIRKLRVLCAQIVPSDFTMVAVLQKEGDKYSVYEWGAEDAIAQVRADLENNGHTWLSWFLLNREEPLIVSQSQLELQQMPVIVPEETFPQLAVLLAIPMRHQQKCIGALLLGNRHEGAFTSHQSRILSILCNQAAVSLENSSIIQRMEELAITDGLTGLFNHRFFQESIQRELERAERLHQPLSLLILDIDHFKGLNDSFGHPAGDSVLRNLAPLLKKNARKIDILARYGGEEFAALLPGIDAKNARKTAERWRKAIQRASFQWEAKSFTITLSIGFAAYPQDATTKMDLIEKADRALYDAKENGRNQVRHCSDSDERRSSLFR